MIIEIRHTGAISDRGWQRRNVDAPTLEEAAYRAVREDHRFLTDANHTWTAEDGTLRIFRAFDSDPPNVAPMWARADYRAGAQWFAAMQFRLPEEPEGER